MTGLTPAPPPVQPVPFDILHNGAMDPSTLGILYEAFDPAFLSQASRTTSGQPETGWTIDSLFLGTDYV